jgi:hypothetical protein
MVMRQLADQHGGAVIKHVHFTSATGYADVSTRVHRLHWRYVFVHGVAVCGVDA